MLTEAEKRSSAIGRYIKDKRVDAGLTQVEVAKRIEFTQRAVSNWELGDRIPTAKAIAALARALPGASVLDMLTLLGES